MKPDENSILVVLYLFAALSGQCTLNRDLHDLTYSYGNQRVYSYVRVRHGMRGIFGCAIVIVRVRNYCTKL